MDMQAARLEDAKWDMKRVRVIPYKITGMNAYVVFGVTVSGTDYAAVAVLVWGAVCVGYRRKACM
jgi:hypothetical protein